MSVYGRESKRRKGRGLNCEVEEKVENRLQVEGFRKRGTQKTTQGDLSKMMETLGQNTGKKFRLGKKKKDVILRPPTSDRC